MAPATAQHRAIRAAPDALVDARPDLRVVDDAVDDASRRSLGGLVGTLSVVLLFVSIFGVVIFQVLMVQTQSQLDDLGSELTTEQSMAKELDLEIANLESPERIVAAADGLGMIVPDKTVYLEAVDGADGRIGYDAATEPTGISDPTADVSGAAPVDPTASTPGGTPAPAGPALPPGPPYTAENNWGAGGPPTTPPVYTAANNWGAGSTSTAPGAAP